jgi:hypothetical protein
VLKHFKWIAKEIFPAINVNKTKKTEQSRVKGQPITNAFLPVKGQAGNSIVL